MRATEKPMVTAAHVTARLLQDVLLEQTAAYWDRRAGQFAAVGTKTAAEKAEACRRHAWFVREYGDVESVDTLRDVLAELVDGSPTQTHREAA